jgi:pimeloyl-ACP methyl ester carboxylesterase
MTVIKHTEIRDAGHFPFIEKTEEFNQIIDRFLLARN